MNSKCFFHIVVLFFASIAALWADDGSALWLRAYSPDSSVGSVLREEAEARSPLEVARVELRNGWKGAPVVLRKAKEARLQSEGFLIQRTAKGIRITSPSEAGLLYGVYHLLRLQALQVELPEEVCSNPCMERRLLNHWDNLNGTVERGFAGRSLWKWEVLNRGAAALPDSLAARYRQYARANASIGINGTVLNNVNASPRILTNDYLQGVKVLADLFRPYGVKVYLSVNFSTPKALGELPTGDPLDAAVVQWWQQKVKEIYKLIPDFGGFLVKANSEGEPGPGDYGRTHAEGANLLADALRPYHGVVMWRTFVYNPEDSDRAKQAYQEFQPLDGKFRENVILQIKNGPIDFQPREPYSPLFGALKQTKTMPEFQITQEYLGMANHLVFLAPLWKEFYEQVEPTQQSAVAGVANIGEDRNWCGHPFAQANWYAFGRLAWEPSLASEAIADEWIRLTISSKEALVAPVKRMMLESREAAVNYMMPLGLHHLFAFGHHYGPEPWCSVPGARPDWLPSYYHKADSVGLGFNRSSTGSNAVAQYPEPLRSALDDPTTCPERYLLWFHHLSWNFRMKDGRTLWENLCGKYQQGVEQVRSFQQTWAAVEPWVDKELFREVQRRLKRQCLDAMWWRDACLLYFQQFSQQPIPGGQEQPVYDLQKMMQFRLEIDNYQNAPGGYGV